MLLLIALSFEGLSIDDLRQLIPNKTDVEIVLEKLEVTSLVEFDQESRMFKVQNFIMNYVEFRLKDKEEEKLGYLMMLTNHFSK